jgi:two-component system, LytTR family, response regulator
MTGIAIDDEPIALEVIRSLADKVPFLHLQASFVSATEAFAYLQQQPADLLFLDIHMPDLSGLELARMIGPHMKIIFTTAHADFALQGFDLAAVDYLLKPIAFPRFLLACQRAKERLEVQAIDRQAVEPAYLFVKNGYDLVRVDLRSLLYIEADDNYMTFHEPARKSLTRMTLTEILQKLPEREFMRVHKSFVVAVSKIEKVERHQLTVAGKNIPLSASYRELLLDRLGK